MKLKVSKEGLELSSLVKMVVVGYVISASILFTVAMLLLSFSAPTMYPIYKLWAAPLIVPIVFTMQGLLFAGAIALGLFIYKKWRPIEVVINE
jgi:hypothetical protein